jgi:hypothetical protein
MNDRRPAPWGRRSRLLALACFPLILEGCIAIPIPQRLGGGSARFLERKIVADLREPNILIASDRTTCEVSMDRYERTRRGDRVTCDWRREVR